MVKRANLILVVVFALQISTDAWGSATNVVFHTFNSQVVDALAKAEKPSRKEMRSEFKTVRSAFEQLLRCSASGDVEGFISCFAKDQQKRFSGNKPASSPSFHKKSADLSKAGFADVRIESLEFTSSQETAKLTGIFVSSRRGNAVREKLNIELVDTDDGWKITAFRAIVLPDKKDPDRR